jgi:hypothetical protein
LVLFQRKPRVLKRSQVTIRPGRPFCGLFNGSVSSYSAEWEGIWKEAAVTSFSVLSRHLPGGMRKNHEGPQESRCPGRDSNRAPRIAKSRALPPSQPALCYFVVETKIILEKAITVIRFRLYCSKELDSNPAQGEYRGFVASDPLITMGQLNPAKLSY